VIRALEPRSRIQVHVFRAITSDVPLAIDDTWACEMSDRPPVAALDPLALLELRPRERRPAPANVQALLLRRGDDAVAFAVAGAPEGKEALRVCPTPPDAAFEVVELDGDHGLLLRPEVLFSLREPNATSGREATPPDAD
jgi:hypothetical protein